MDVADSAALLINPTVATRDATARVRAEQTLLLRAERHAHMGRWEWHVVTGQLHWSPEMHHLHRIDIAQIQPTLGLALSLIHPDDRARYQAITAEGLRSGGSISCEYRLQFDDNSIRYLHSEAEVIRDAAGHPVQVIGFVQDVTERLHVREHLQFIAHHDALTALPNRILFIDRLTHALTYARWHRRLVAVMLIDLDRLKSINSTQGHGAGDDLLQQLATRLTQVARERDTVARLGGDEFAILLDDVASEDEVATLARNILAAITLPFLIGDHAFHLTASMGISLYPGDGLDHTELLRIADIALYRAKEQGKNNFQFYSAEMSSRAFERLAMETRLRRALQRNEFVVHYQPQIDTQHNRVVGVEALLRWNHPERGRLAPADFVPLLEDTGLITQVGDWVLRSACEQARWWIKAGLAPLRMSVNFSAQQVRQTGFLQSIATLTHEYELPAGCLTLEISEQVLIHDAERALMSVANTQCDRWRLAIDDFGSGYSSLRHLKRLPIDTLKIDRTFVRDVSAVPQSAAIARSIIALANSLKLGVIAEGVENAEQLNFLQAEGCYVVQGYYLCPPLPAAEATAYLVSRQQEDVLPPL